MNCEFQAVDREAGLLSSQRKFFCSQFKFDLFCGNEKMSCLVRWLLNGIYSNLFFRGEYSSVTLGLGVF